MKRFFIILLVTLIVLILGLVLLVRMNSEKVTAAISKAVESATGQPLYTTTIPSLSFFPTPGIELGQSNWGNPKTDEVSISVSRCVFRLSLMKLFVGTIAIDKILLDQPTVVIQKNKKTLSTSTTIASTQKKDVDTSFHIPTIMISSLTIKNGTLKFVDGHKQILLTELHVSAKNILPQHTGSISITTKSTFQPEDIAFTTELNSSITLDTNTLSLEKLKVIITPNKGLALKSPVTIIGNGRYFINKNTLETSKLQLQLEHFNITSNGSLDFNTNKGMLAISAEGSLKNLSKALGLLVITPDSKALETFSVDTKAYVNGNHVSFTDLTVVLDDSQITGKINIQLPQKLSGDLALTSINLDRYLPISISEQRSVLKLIEQNTSTTNHYATKPQIPSKQPLPNVDIKLTAKNIVISQLHIQNLNSQLQGVYPEYTLNPCTFTFYESPVSITGKGTFATLPRYEASITSPHINLAALLTDISKNSVVEGGHISLTANLSATGSKSIQLKQTLSGTANLDGKNIIIQFASMPKVNSEITKLSKQTFTELKGKLKSTNGIINIEEFILTGTPVSASAVGMIVLPNNSMNVDGNIAINNTVIPIHISGDLSNPSYRVDPAKLLQGAINTIIKNKEKDLIDNIPLPNNTKETIHEATEKIFNKIFGR